MALAAICQGLHYADRRLFHGSGRVVLTGQSRGIRVAFYLRVYRKTRGAGSAFGGGIIEDDERLMPLN